MEKHRRHIFVAYSLSVLIPRVSAWPSEVQAAEVLPLRAAYP